MVNISTKDRNQIVSLLKEKVFFQKAEKLEMILSFAGLEQFRSQISLSGSSEIMVSTIIDHLADYGKFTYDEEALGLFLNAAKIYLGFEDRNFIDNIIRKYNLIKIPVTISDESPLQKRPEPEESKMLQESIIEENTLRPISFLSRAIEVARFVCYITVGGFSSSGFLIGKNIVITNNHVIPDKNTLDDESFFRFNYQIGVNGQPEQMKTYKAVQNGVFHTNPELDYTIVQLENSPGTEWGTAELAMTAPKVKSRVNIINHPGGLPKHISIQNNVVEYVDNRIIQYLTSNFRGSSGCPIFNDEWQVVAMHQMAGRFSVINEQENVRYYTRNQGIMLSSIINDLPKNNKNKINQ